MGTLHKPIFDKAPEKDIFKDLKAEVQQQLARSPGYANDNILKTFIYLGLFLFAYAGMLLWGDQTWILFSCYIICGICMIVLFLNAFHDAAHNALFKQHRHNLAFCYLLEFFGSNNFIWRRRHLLLHHPYPNVLNWDIDMKQSDLARIFPKAKWLPVHRYQHVYMWLLYPMYTLNWFFIRDFRDFFGTKNNYLKRIIKIPTIEYIKLFLAKIFHIAYLIVLPALVLNQPWTRILLAWLVMHIVASCLGTIALLSTHVDEHASFPVQDENGHINNTWFGHQIEVTKDFNAESPVARHLFGGFSHHIAHHLFPGVPHDYYPAITKIIRRYAHEYQLPYQNYPFYAAIRSHFRLLKNNGQEHNLFKTGEL